MMMRRAGLSAHVGSCGAESQSIPPSYFLCIIILRIILIFKRQLTATFSPKLFNFQQHFGPCQIPLDLEVLVWTGSSQSEDKSPILKVPFL